MHDRPDAASDLAASDLATSNKVKTSVLVVGAGPVGLTLAMDLAQRGISVTVVETRSAGEPPSVKCNHVSSRSMEVFRRLGLAQKLGFIQNGSRMDDEDGEELVFELDRRDAQP